MSLVLDNVHYSAEHAWARLDDDGVYTIGITDFAQEALGDVVFVQLPEVETSVQAGQQVCLIESVKSASDVYTPISGTIIAVNDELNASPERINEEPYGAGWLFRIRADGEVVGLLDANGYQRNIA